MTTSRMLSMPVWLAASISSTSMSRPCAISTQASHSPHGSAVGPFTQLSARARMRAVVVLPQPREPANTNACAMRPLAMRVAQRARDRLLPDDIVEPLRPPLAGEDLIGHSLDQELECGSEIRQWVGPTATRCTCGTPQGLLSAAAFRP